MLNSIKQQIEKLKIVAEDPETPKVMKIALAPRPLKMSSPRWELYFPGGTFLGCFLGFGLAFLFEFMNDFLRTPKDVSRYVKTPLLGVIPDAAEDSQLQDVDLCHVVRQAPYSIVSESYRRLQVNLKLSDSGSSSKVIFISSIGAGDGKTAVAINLATTFVAENKKVLLIDTNFWRGTLHKAFPKAGLDSKCDETVKSDVGLSNILSGECASNQVIRHSGIEGFDVIDSGTMPPNPTQLLASPRMKQLINQQRELYDYIILDGPPVLLVSGAKVLTKFVDGTILVLNASSTRKGAAVRAVRELQEINAPVIGCVLMAAKVLKGGYFQEQFRSYQEYHTSQLAGAV
jgi:capsular exopolysaccharide synthesis family protein